MLQIRNLGIAFMDGPKVVDDVSLSLAQKERLVIIGETGSGKSVLLLAALRLLPTSARVTGEIIFKSEDLLGCTKAALNRLRGVQISYIPQGSGNGLNPLYTVGHQIREMLSRRQKAPKQELTVKAVELLQNYGLDEPEKLLKSYPFMLSGGMRQRVLIAMAIASDADLILADEPTKGLDVRRINLVADSFRNLYDRTILCVTHDIRFAKAIGTKIAVIYASCVVETADAAEFFENPLHPYAQAMLCALPENGLQVQSGFAPPRARGAESNCQFYKRCIYKEKRCEKNPPLLDLGNRKVRCWRYAT